MRITLLVIGKTDDDYLRDGIQKYLSRLIHYVNFEMKILPDVKQGKNFNADKMKAEEGKLILKALHPGDHVLLLDETGKTFSSKEFASFLENKMNQSMQHLVFIIGGPFGFSEEVYERASGNISLSRMTFSHQMVRLFFTEQLYRAFTILRGEKYHH